MATEERSDPLPAIFGRLGIVLRFHRTHFSDRRQNSAVATHEAVPGFGIDLHVVLDSEFAEQLIEPSALRRETLVLLAITAQHRAYAAQLFGRLQHVAIERSRDSDLRASRVPQPESSAHADAA